MPLSVYQSSSHYPVSALNILKRVTKVRFLSKRKLTRDIVETNGKSGQRDNRVSE